MSDVTRLKDAWLINLVKDSTPEANSRTASDHFYLSSSLINNRIFLGTINIDYRWDWNKLMRTLLISLALLVTSCQATLNPQVKNARESEAKTILGAWTRSQQSYHLTKDKFAASNSELDLSIPSGKYYDFKVREVGLKGAYMTADPKQKYEQLSGYIATVSYTNGEYISGVCQLENKFDSYDNFYDIEFEDCLWI